MQALIKLDVPKDLIGQEAIVCFHDGTARIALCECVEMPSEMEGQISLEEILNGR